jgi:hypothetical protein
MFGLGSGSNRVRSRGTLLSCLALWTIGGIISASISSDRGDQVRDRFGFRRQRKVTKMNHLEIFNLAVHTGGFTGTENHRVGGSIPPPGTIPPDFQTVIQWVARGLMVAVSVDSRLWQEGVLMLPILKHDHLRIFMSIRD